MPPTAYCTATPRVAVVEQRAEFGIIGINPMVLSDADVEVVGTQLVRLFYA